MIIVLQIHNNKTLIKKRNVKGGSKVSHDPVETIAISWSL